MIAGQAGARKLVATIKAAMIITTKQRAVAQGRAKPLYDPALDSDDGLQVEAGTYAVEALHATEYGRQGIPDAVNDIALGVRSNCLVQGNPTARLASEIQSQDNLHGHPPTNLG